MILTGTHIKTAVSDGTIDIEPFDDRLLNPNSYNYRLNGELLVTEGFSLDSREQPKTSQIQIPSQGYVLQPDTLYLGYTFEEIGSSDYVPSLIGRSSLGRLGLFLQITADLGNLGTKHKWTLEMTVVQPLRVYADMRIGQVSFWQPDGLELLEGKRYRHQPGAYARYSTAAPSDVTKFFE